VNEEKDMRTYDVSVPISTELVTWPGDPKIAVERVERMEDGAEANVTRINMSAHSGTHVDAPCHFIEDGASVDQLPIDLLTGRVYVLDLSNEDVINSNILENSSIPPRTRRVLFKTRNSDYWARRENQFRTDYVALSADAASFLVDRGVRLVGVDYLSVAPFEATGPTHKILLNAGVVIVEGLDLSQVSQGRYMFYCLPLKIEGADGAPARAILVGV
jgi:arylformamidase